MIRLIKASDFLREVSQSPRLKFELTWLTFAGLVVPTALLMSIGLPEQYALPLMLVAILPFQYVAVCILADRRSVLRGRDVVVHVNETAGGVVATDGLVEDLSPLSEKDPALKVEQTSATKSTD